MVTVTVNLGECGSRFLHKEADGYYSQDGILHVTKDKEIIASYPQAGVMGVEKAECCCGKG